MVKARLDMLLSVTGIIAEHAARGAVVDVPRLAAELGPRFPAVRSDELVRTIEAAIAVTGASFRQQAVS